MPAYLRHHPMTPPRSRTPLEPLGKRRRGAIATLVAAFTLAPITLHAQYPVVGLYPLAPTPYLNPASLAPEPRVSGYLIVRETVRDDSAAFRIWRARIGAQALVAPFVALKLQADLSALGQVSNDTVPGFQITDAYAQLWANDTSNRLVRALRPTLYLGQFKAPFSLEYNTSSSLVMTATRSLIVERHSARRELGALGHLRFSRWALLAGAVVNGEGANRIANPDGKQMAIGRLTVFPIPRLALSAKILNQGDDHRWGYDGRFFLNGDELIVEGEAIKRTSPSGVNELDAGGGYALVAYRPLSWVQPLVKWERLRELTITPTTANEIEVRNTTFGVNFYAPRDRVRLIVNWIAKSGDVFNGEDELVVQLVAIY